MVLNRMQHLLNEPKALIEHIAKVLQQHSCKEPIFPAGVSNSNTAAAVLCLLSLCREKEGKISSPCFVFNKRSSKIRQAGDLCFPGGRMMPRFDFYLSYFLRLPFSPLTRWSYWSWWKKQRRVEVRRLSLLLTAGLRESLEEMRLNPLGVRFLGPMPAQRLRMFAREIYPMVVWIERQQHFFLNREVEKIIHVPIGYFLEPTHYARCRISFGAGRERPEAPATEMFPCFCIPHRSEQEILWGATYRMVMNFLDMVFDFRPPQDALPVVTKRLGTAYTGPVIS